MSTEGEAKELQVLTISGTIYAEDHLIEELKKRGKTEKTSWMLANLLGRFRRSQIPGIRQTPTGNTLRLVRDDPIEGEVVDDKEE